MTVQLGPPPPPDGLHRAFATARGRRLRALGLMAGPVVVAGLVVMFGLPGTVGRSTLVVDTGPVSGGRGRSSGPARHGVSPDAPGKTSDVGRRPAYGDGGAPAGRGGVAPGGRAAGADPSKPQPVKRSTYPWGAPSVCQNDDPTDHAWCVFVDVTKAAGGQRTLQIEVCRSASPAVELTFETEQEVEFVVVTGSGEERWRWSADRRFAARHHTAALPRLGCLSWTTAWYGVDGAGARLPAGRYVLRASVLAAETPLVRDVEDPFQI